MKAKCWLFLPEFSQYPNIFFPSLVKRNIIAKTTIRDTPNKKPNQITQLYIHIHKSNLRAMDTDMSGMKI